MPNKSPESLRVCPFDGGRCPINCDVNALYRSSKSYLKGINFGGRMEISPKAFSKIITGNPKIEPLVRKACLIEKNKDSSNGTD